MRLHLLAVAAFLACTATVFGISASPFPIDLRQPDGKVVRLYVRGDEYMNWFEDMQGFTVVRNGAQYVYATLAADGRLAPTALRVGAVNPVASGLSKRVRPTAGAIREARIQTLPPAKRAAVRSGFAAAESLEASTPASGTVKNLVILCKFSDHDNTKIRAQSDFDVLFNSIGGDASLAPTGSVRDYYTETSYGIITLQSTVVAWVTLPQTEAYYANGSSGLGGTYPANPQGMVKDALDLVDPMVNFGQFDANNDGYIDAIDIIHSGFGAETGGGGGNWIWSHKWSLYQLPGGKYTTADTNALGTPVKVYDYHTEPALWGTSGTAIARIGVICHETGHFFGLPDLYDTDGTSEGIGSYCLMANSWGFDFTQLHPPHFSAWCKIQLGWVTPTLVSGGTISAPRVATDKAIFRVNTGYPGTEYLLIENRQPFGFENDMPQGGLAIWHIDDAKSANTAEGYPGQSGWPTNNNHYRVALLQADGLYEMEKDINRGNAGDVYRGGGVSSITPATTPNTDRYQGGTVTPSNTSITSISAPANTMTFTLSNTVYPAITSAITDTGTQGTPFSYQITASNNPTSYSSTTLPSGLSLNAGSGLISGTPSGSGTFSVTLTATNASGSASATFTLTITSTTPQPNLTPYQPAGWSDKIVISNTAGTNIDSPGLIASDSLYLDFAVINNGAAATGSQFSTEVYVDNVLRATFQTSPPLNSGAFTTTQDYSLGSLGVGNHTIRIKVDSAAAIPESDESDNEFTRTITVAPVIAFDSFTGASLTSTGSTPRSFMGFPPTMSNAAGASNITITGGSAYLVSNSAATYTNIRLNITFWGTASGATSGTTPAFSNSLGTYSFDFGARTTAANTYYTYSFTLPSPVILPLQTCGVTVNWQGDTGSGLASNDNLTSLIRYGAVVATGALTLGTAGTNGYYRNASSETDGNFLGSSFRSLGQTNQGLALQLIGAPTDTTPPTVTVTPNGTVTNSSPLNFVITFSESVTGLTAAEINVTNGTKGTLTGSGTTYTLPVTPSGQGAVLCQVTAGAAQDGAGNGNTISNNASVTFDSVTLNPTLIQPASSSLFATSVSVSFSLPETAFASSVKLAFSGPASRTLNLAASQETSGPHSFIFDAANPTLSAQVDSVTGGSSVPDGLYTAMLTYQDALGNPSASAMSTSVRIDTTAPTLNLPTPIVATATSPGGASVTYTFNPDDPGGSGVASFSANPPSGSTFAVGVTTINATATDHAGNVANGNFTVTVNANPPPGGGTLSFTPNTAMHQGDSLTLNAPGWTDPDMPLTYQFFLGASSLNSPGATSSLGIGAPAPGSYTLKVRVTDSAGSFTDSTQPLTVVAFSSAESWRQTYFGDYRNSGNAADNADPDGDGLRNIVEFANGTNPTNAGSGGPALVYTGTLAGGGAVTATGHPVTRIEGNDVRALFVRRTDYAAAGLGYAAEFSPDLANWTASGATPTVLADDGTFQIVSVPYPPPPPDKRNYFRIRVTIAP